VPAHATLSLRSKLLRITATIMLLLSVVMLSSMAWMNYVTETDRLADIERHIRESITSKGATLTDSHALALKSLVADNAFSDVRSLVERAVGGDTDVVYGLFLGAENKPWAYVSPTTRLPGAGASPDAWKDLELDADDLLSREVGQRKTSLFGKEIEEFSVAVRGDEHERLGTIVYGLSNERMHQAVAAARVRSRQALIKALTTIAALGLFTLALGMILVSRAAALMTAPIVKLTAAANKIASGERGIRVDIESGDEVEVLAAAFNQMLEANEDAMLRLEVTTNRALEADRLKGEFLANMSHEIRTPMNGVLGMVKLMQAQPLEGKLWRYVETIDASANALLTILNDILDLSKLEAGKYTIQSIPFQPKVVIQEVAELLASRAHDKQIELIHRTDPLVPTFAIGDPDRLKQVLNNLVGNAIKFTDKGEVFVNATVGSRLDDGIVLRVAVHDSGIGIDSADLPKLYEVFSQVDGSMARRHGGTGLGLAISKRLVKMMGGDIQVQSQVGVGSVFTFTVKLGIDERAEVPSRRSTGVAGKRVLVVEASRRWRDVISEHLQAWRMECEVVERGASVLEKLGEAAGKGRPFDVLLIGKEPEDVRVPEILKSVRAEEALRGLPVVLLTPPQGGPMLLEREREGVSQLHKPIRFSELYNCLDASMSGRHRPAAATDPRPTPTATSDKTILVVDDNEVNQFVAVEELELRGYRAEVASNGREAVEKVNTGVFDGVLMDCQMPVMDGYTATQEIRKWEASRGTDQRIPIIALTAHALAGERERVLAAGMDDYLSKPFRPSALEKLLRIYVGGTGEPEVADAPSTATDSDELAPDTKRSEKLIRLFLERVPEQITELGKSIAHGDPPAIRLLAHKLKGSCLAIGAGPMSKVAEALQHMAEKRDLAQANDLFAELKRRHARVESLLHAELGPGTVAKSGPLGTPEGVGLDPSRESTRST
jgi:signal transduction histidine kinase/DNA-binding response OmpR family regulator